MAAVEPELLLRNISVILIPSMVKGLSVEAMVIALLEVLLSLMLMV